MASSALRKLMRRRFGEAFGDETKSALAEAVKHGDRAAAIVLTAALEDGLRRLIAGLLPGLPGAEADRLFDDRGVLYTLDARIQMGRALGAYGPKTEEALNRIRLIRNTFAHAWQPVTFGSAEIAAACALIDVEHIPGGRAAKAGLPPGKEARTRFALAAGALLYRFDHQTLRRAYLEEGLTKEGAEALRPDLGDEDADEVLRLLETPRPLP